MTVTGIAFVITSSVTVRTVDKARSKQFSCGEDCGVFGDELKSQLESIQTISVISLIVGVIALAMFLLRGWYKESKPFFESKFGSFTLFITTLGSFILTTLAAGMVSLGTLEFLKTNAIVPANGDTEEWTYTKSLKGLDTIIWWNFALNAVLALLGHMCLDANKEGSHTVLRPRV